MMNPCMFSAIIEMCSYPNHLEYVSTIFAEFRSFFLHLDFSMFSFILISFKMSSDFDITDFLGQHKPHCCMPFSRLANCCTSVSLLNNEYCFNSIVDHVVNWWVLPLASLSLFLHMLLLMYFFSWSTSATWHIAEDGQVIMTVCLSLLSLPLDRWWTNRDVSSYQWK